MEFRGTVMHGVKKWLAGSAFALALAAPAGANVIYEFSGFGIDFDTGAPNAFALTFVYNAPSFFTTNADPAPAAGLTSCSADPPFTCTSVSFLPDSTPITGSDNYDMVLFSAAPGTTWYFYFANGILSVPGTHANTLLIGSQDATLKITDTGGGGGVPEPGTLALLAIALASGGMVVRRRGRR